MDKGNIYICNKTLVKLNSEALEGKSNMLDGTWLSLTLRPRRVRLGIEKDNLWSQWANNKKAKEDTVV